MAFVGIRPNIMEVNPLTKAGLPKDYRKVPIAIIDEEQIKGSDEIIQALLDHPAVQRQISDNDFASSQWVEFANKDLGALLYPNICSSLSESYKAFGYVDNIDSFSLLQKFSIKALGSVAMYMAASRIKGE
jgi:microsomal prostaglandin-E synthase 2